VKVIFLEDVPKQASAGEVKNVANGYARNYLVPRKLAVLATPEEMKRIEGIKRAGNARRLRETEQWQVMAKQLEGTAITVKARLTPTGQFYGAITPGQIAQELGKVIGREMDRKLVEAVEPIRGPGEYEVVLHLAPEIDSRILVTAEGEE
jgi:large subunit ribosomal protein L9